VKGNDPCGLCGMVLETHFLFLLDRFFLKLDFVLVENFEHWKKESEC